MDYAFAPGVTGYDALMRKLLRNRADTELIHDSSITHVAGFIDHLVTTTSISKPVGDLRIASHGNDEGWMQIDLDGEQPTNTTYEVLEQAEKSGSVKIPDVLLQRPDGSLVSISVHIRGCRVGESQPFMDKLKKVFGEMIGVTAPRHFHMVWELTSHGMFEFLSYGFRVINQTAFPQRSAAVDAFKVAGFAYIDGSEVPDNKWEGWIPRNVNRAKTSSKMYVELGTAIGTLRRLRVEREFRHTVRRYTFTIGGLPANPPTNAERLTVLREAISTNDLFKATHPYPEYERWGYDSTDDFVDNLRWQFNWKSGKLVCNGTRHDYVVIIPITEFDTAKPDSSPLIFNFYPPEDSAFAQIDDRLVESDDRMFASV